MKSQEDYADTWSELMNECAELENKRTDIEEQLDEIKKRIDHLNEVLRHLAPLAGMSFDEDLAGLGMTDAIRHVLETSNERLSAQDVRRVLTGKGFDLSGYSAPMASIYKVLSRLADDQDSPVIREREGNTVFYSWQRPTPQQDDFAQQAEISDDDIPF